MRVFFEELPPAKRAGGIEAATGGLAAALSRRGILVHRVDVTGMRDSSSEQPEIVHIHGIWSPNLWLRWQKWLKAGVPCILTTHGMLEPWSLNHKKIKKHIALALYQKKMLNCVQLLHATCDRERANLRQLGLKTPAALIPWGIEVLRDDTGSDDCLGLARGEASSRIALFVGRIYPVKGLPLFVDAWAKVMPRGWKMRIVGPDEAGHRSEVEALAAKFGLSGIFEFAGPLSGEALAAEYRNASLFVLPSHTENFGMVVGEAMAHGLPVITTHGAPWKVLEEEGCGWWVPVSVEGIASALADATGRFPEELIAMGGRGRRVVEERFSWDKIAQDFIACYAWLLERGPKPACIV